MDLKDRKFHAAANRLPTHHGSHTRRLQEGWEYMRVKVTPSAASLLILGVV